jgi:hypothetical protein
MKSWISIYEFTINSLTANIVPAKVSRAEVWDSTIFSSELVSVPVERGKVMPPDLQRKLGPAFKEYWKPNKSPISSFL